MFKNYLKVSWRILRKNRGYSLLNISGLAVGIAVCILIFLWARDELSFDRFHQNVDDLYIVYSKQRYSDGRLNMSALSFYPLAAAVKEECPEVGNAVRIMEAHGVVINREDKVFSDDTIGLVDAAFFDLFSFPFVAGDKTTAFQEKFAAVITEETSRKFFGDEEPMGKILTVNGQIDFSVTGVVRDMPGNSSFQFDVIIPFYFAFGGPGEAEPQHWGGNPLNTYVLLRPGSIVPEVERKITAAVNRRMTVPEGMTVSMGLQPLRRMHLYDLEGGGPILTVIIFSSVALLVLIIACINFINLTTARATTRTAEIGLRKVVGAKRADLVKQFFGESVIISILAFIAALLLASLTLPAFNTLSGKHLTFGFSSDMMSIAGVAGIALFTGLLAGIYPALVISSVRPVRLFRNAPLKGTRGGRLRVVLVVAQYTISIFLIIGTLIIDKQLRFINARDMGYDKDNLILVDLPQNSRSRYESLKAELLRYPAVQNVTRSVQSVDNINSTVSALDWDGKDPAEKISINWDYVDYDYFETLGLTIVEGRSFSPEHATDLEGGYIVNEEAVRLMGMESAVNKRLSVFREEGTIVGVVKDFHYKPLRHKIGPLVFGMNPAWRPQMRQMLVRVAAGSIADSLRTIEDTFKKTSPGSPFVFHFFDDLTARHYEVEQRSGRLLGTFTLLALFISGMGLFGLAAFTAEQKTKEIGIRKVLGATTMKIVVLLSGTFAKWVLVANFLAWPAAYFGASRWLQNYAFRTKLTPGLFVLAAGMTLAIALLTVILKTAQAAAANPVDTLRYE